MLELRHVPERFARTNHRPGAGVTKKRLALRGAIRHVERHRYRSEARDRKIGDEKLGHVRQLNRDDVAASNTHPMERARQALGLRAQLTIGDDEVA